MIPLVDKENAQAPDADYPYGRLKDDSGLGDGVPVNTNVYGDIHQFFERMMAIAAVSPNGLPDNEYSGFQLFEALLALNGGTLVKLINIGDWNMDSDATKFVTHGLDQTKIVAAEAYIKADLIIGEYNAVSLLTSGSVGWGSSVTNIVLNRDNGGDFDNANYNDTSYNRGFVIIRYLP